MDLEIFLNDQEVSRSYEMEVAEIIINFGPEILFKIHMLCKMDF